MAPVPAKGNKPPSTNVPVHGGGPSGAAIPSRTIPSVTALPPPSGLPGGFTFKPELHAMERVNIPHTAWHSRMGRQ
jgi:hypothetical protein